MRKLNPIEYICDVVWATEFLKDSRTDSYFGEVSLLFAYFYRCLIVINLIATIVSGSILAFSPILLLWVTFVSIDAITSTPAFKRAAQKNNEDYIIKMAAKRKQDHLDKILLHKNDPPMKIVIKH